MNDGERNFTQAAAEFHRLKEQFEAGSLSEAELKTQLQDLLVQDEQGYWWMIGYETGQWYRHDGSTSWVQADPLVIVPQETPPPPISSPAIEPSVVAKEELVVETLIPPAVEQPVKPASTLRNRFWRGVGLVLGISVLDILVSSITQILGQGGITRFFFLPFTALSSILFGPWVGGFVSALSSTISFLIMSQQGSLPWSQGVITLPIIFLYGMIPGLLVKDARNWKAVLAVGILLGAFNYLSFSLNPQVVLNVVYLITAVLLPYLILLPLLAWLLAEPVRRWGWYWRELHPQTGRVRMEAAIPVLLTSIGWCVVWGIPLSIGLSTGNITPALGIAGILSGLVCGLVLRWKARAVRWYHLLLIMAGWGIGLSVAQDPLNIMIWNGSIGFLQWIELAIAGLIGGGVSALVLKWGKIITQWRQVPLIAGGWAIGMVIGENLVYWRVFWSLTSWIFIFIVRFLATGLLTGAVGAGIMFWALRKNLPVEK